MTDLGSMIGLAVVGLSSLIVAVLLLIITWIVAGIVKKLILKVGKKAQLPQKLVKCKAVQSEEKGDELLGTFGALGALIVWIVMLPSILDKLGMASVSSSLTSMVKVGLGFIPNIIGAAILFFVGYLIAKIVKEVVTGLLSSVGVDRLVAKIPGMKKEEYGVSKVIGTILFVMIMYPIVISVLQALNLSAVAQPAIDLLQTMMLFVPNIIVAIIMIVIGLVLAKLIGGVLEKLLVTLGVDKALGYEQVKKIFVNTTISKLITQIVQVVIIVVFAMEAINALNLAILTSISTTLLGFMPNVISALVIIIVTFVIIVFATSILEKFIKSKCVITLVKVLVSIFGFFMVLKVNCNSKCPLFL